MSLIVGTAGHIDHGKTSLIKALTGQDTDRLKEERERGISIELGFAHLDLPGGTRAGIVDVPGHERFIRNMLAGAHGIDLVLFTVAADDGIMPQTEEHLDIVHLLGITRAIFVLTKVDLVPPARRREVEDDIQILVAGTALEDSPVLPFSAVTLEGLEELRVRIVQMLETAAPPGTDGYFRLPVDRAFVLQGHGVVVTGTALRGEVHEGDRLHALPGGHAFRVRSLQVHGESVPVATKGQRIALNLAGPETAGVERGDVICHEKLTTPTARFDAHIEVRPTARRTVRSHQRVRVHLGTAERMAKVIVLGADDAIAPKAFGYCQIVLTLPVLARRGDRFIVRDETAQRTLAGGIVLQPWASPHRRRETGLVDALRVLHEGTPAAAVAAFVEQSGELALPAATLLQFLDLTVESGTPVLEQSDGLQPVAVEGDVLYTTRAKLGRLRTAIEEELRAFHLRQPLAPGMEMEELRTTLAAPARARGELRFVRSLTTRLFRSVVDQLGPDVVVREASLLRLPQHTVRLAGAEKGLMEQVLERLEGAGLTPPDLKEIVRACGTGLQQLAEVLRVMEREGSVVKVTSELYFTRDALETLKAALREGWGQGEDISPSAFRERFGTSRKYAIPLLEHLDREGVTVRVGDVRRLRDG